MPSGERDAAQPLWQGTVAVQTGSINETVNDAVFTKTRAKRRARCQTYMNRIHHVFVATVPRRTLETRRTLVRQPWPKMRTRQCSVGYLGARSWRALLWRLLPKSYSICSGKALGRRRSALLWAIIHRRRPFPSALEYGSRF